jgi:hypothetical protein
MALLYSTLLPSASKVEKPVRFSLFCSKILALFWANCKNIITVFGNIIHF